MEKLTNFEKAETYYNGTDNTQDINAAIKLYGKAANEDDDPIAVKKLSYIYGQNDTEHYNPQLASFWNAIWDYLDDNNLEAFNAFNTLVAENADLNGDAHYWLARCYSEGCGVTMDKSEAFRLYLEACQFGHTRSYKIVGDLFLYNGNEKNALLYLLAAAELGDSNSMTLLGLYNYGEEELGVQYLKKASELGSAGAFYHLGNYFYEGIKVKRDVRLAIEYHTKSYEIGGHIEPIHQLIEIFEKDDDFKDETLASYWKGIDEHEIPSNDAFPHFEKAAEKNHVKSLYFLGYYYLNGFGTTKNVEKAIQLLEVAADGGSHEALMELGELYFDGHSIKQNYDKALNYYLKAIDHNDKEALFKVGLLYDQGLVGEDSDIDKAFPYMNKAAKLGHPEALFFIGDYYENGYVVAQNDEKSYEYYMRSAFKDSSDGCRLVGEAYHNGFGVEENLNEALKWYLRGAERDNLASVNDVIECYEEGIGTEIDLEEAKLWKAEADRIRKTLL